MHKCQVKDCTNDANERPVIHIWAKHCKPSRHQPAEMHIGELWTCKACQPKFTAESFLDGAMGRARIISAFEQQGKLRPAFKTAKLIWIGEDEG